MLRRFTLIAALLMPHGIAISGNMAIWRCVGPTRWNTARRQATDIFRWLFQSIGKSLGRIARWNTARIIWYRRLSRFWHHLCLGNFELADWPFACWKNEETAFLHILHILAVPICFNSQNHQRHRVNELVVFFEFANLLIF